jgi:hypothetical protein
MLQCRNLDARHSALGAPVDSENVIVDWRIRFYWYQSMSRMRVINLMPIQLPLNVPFLALTFSSEFTYHADPSKFATTVRFYLKAAHVVQKHHRR